MDEYKKKKSKRHSCEFSDSEQQYSTKIQNVEGRLKKKKKKSKRHSCEFSDSEQQCSTKIQNVEGRLKKKKKKCKRYSSEFSDSEQQYSTKVEIVEGRLKKKKKKHKDNQVDEEKNDNKDCNSYAAKNELKCVEEVSQLYHNEPVSDCIESNNTFNEKKRKKHKRKKSIHCDTQEHNGDIDVETGLCKSRSKKRKLDHYLSPDSKLCESVNETAGNVMKDCNCSSEQSKKKKEAGYSGKEHYLNEFIGDSIYKKKNRKNKHIPFPVTTCEGNSNLNKTNELKDGHHLTFSEIDKEDLTVFDEYSTKNRSKFFNKNNLSNRDTNSDTSNVPCAVKDQEKSSSHCDRNDMWLSEHYDLMSVDSFDYTDDDYAVPYCSKRRKAEVKKNEKLFENKHNLPLEDELGESEESDSTDNVIAPLYDASYDNVEGNPDSSLKKKRLPGFKSDSCYPTLEKMLYKLPEGEGIPSEEIEEVPEKYQHWKKFREKLNDNAFTEEEIEQEIMDTIKHIHDYFARLEAGSLTEKELEEVKPKNFHGPYFPTPRHIRFFENLNIKINWPLNDLHEFFVTNNYYGKTARMLKDTDIEYITLHSSYAEDMQILKNWKKFQKEYGFYDIRPLTTVRTTRILIDIKGNITFRRFQYVNTENRKRLGLYLVQGLPKRTPLFGLQRLQSFAYSLVDNRLQRANTTITGRMLGKMVYMLERFGGNFHAVELIVGKYTIQQFSSFFEAHIRMKNITLRYGNWTEAETERLRKGVTEVMKVKSAEEVLKRRKVPWLKVMPYVRTRNHRNLKQHLRAMYRTKRQHITRLESATDTAKLIQLVYEANVQHFQSIDFDALAKHFKNRNWLSLITLFRRVYEMKIPHKHCITFEDGVKYLYEKFLPTLKHSIYEIIETSENVSEAEKEAVVTDVNNSSYQCSKQQHDDNSSSQHIEEHDVDDPDDHCPRDDYSDADLGSCAEKQMTDDPKK